MVRRMPRPTAEAESAVEFTAPPDFAFAPPFAAVAEAAGYTLIVDEAAVTDEAMPVMDSATVLPPPASDAEVIAALAKMPDNVVLKCEQLIEQAEFSITATRETINDYREAIESRERDIAEYQSIIDQRRIEIEEAQKEPPRDHSRTVAQLRKHVLCRSVSVCDDVVTVVTQPLFTDIRVAEGSRTTKRTLLGVFEVQLKATEAKIQNRTFGVRHHFATQGGGGMRSVCLGEFLPEYRRAMDAHNIVMAFDIVCQTLLSPLDGATYVRSHDWKATRSYKGKTAPQQTGNMPHGTAYARVAPPTGALVYFNHDNREGYGYVIFAPNESTYRRYIDVLYSTANTELAGGLHHGNGHVPSGRGWRVHYHNTYRIAPSLKAVIETHKDDPAALMAAVEAYKEKIAKKRGVSIFDTLDALTDEEARGEKFNSLIA